MKLCAVDQLCGGHLGQQSDGCHGKDESEEEDRMDI